MTLNLSKEIKIVVSDFDGVFTDGSIYISEKNEVQKKMSFKDIMGVSMLLKAGFNFAIISGEDSNILQYFKDKFGITEIHGGIRQKAIVLDEIMKKYNYQENEVLYIGDDINDIPAMRLVKYRVAPKNHNPIMPFKINELQITQNLGGNGAFREIADILTNMEQNV